LQALRSAKPATVPLRDIPSGTGLLHREFRQHCMEAPVNIRLRAHDERLPYDVRLRLSDDGNSLCTLIGGKVKKLYPLGSFRQ